MFYIPIPLAPPILLVVLVPDFYFSTFKVLIDNRDKPNPYETVEEIGKKVSSQLGCSGALFYYFWEVFS